MYDTYMHIWLLAENWPPRIGGIEKYLTGIASHLPGVTVFAPSETAGDRVDEPYVIRKRFSYKPLWPAWFPLFTSLKRKALEQKPDIIICGKALVEGRIAYRLKRALGIPYVVCTYGMEIATWSSRPRVAKQLSSVLKNADAVLYINEKTKEELKELGAEEDTLIAFYPGVDETELSHMNDPKETREKYGITTSYILCVTRLVKRKGIDDLIEAFTRLEDTNLELMIVGDGPERSSLEAAAKKTNARVRFLGALDDNDIHALYAGATLFALTPKELPGDYEGFGIVYIEAAYAGLPVVATNTGGVPMAVEDGVTGILATPGDISSITEALKKLLANRELAMQYGQAGKRRVETKFLWNIRISQLTSLLERLLV